MAEPLPLLRSGSTKYLMPLLAPGVMRKSTRSSKLAYLRVVMMSPALPPSSPPCSVTEIMPSLTSQPAVGEVGLWSPPQPLEVLPSKRRCQPPAASFAERVLGAVCAMAGRVAGGGGGGGMGWKARGC